MITAYIDGASAGNPGKAGAGYVLFKDNKLIKSESCYLGVQSNNFAEYMALILSLSEIISLGEKKCLVYSDSKLVCEQIKGNFKVKHQNIFPLYVLAKRIIANFSQFSIDYIEREKNKDADKLAKKATGFLA